MHSNPSGSRDLSDLAFTRALESGALAAESFRHFDHLRLAWIYLRQGALREAESRMRATIRSFAEAHGASGKYHETLTVAYMRFVAAHLRMTPGLSRFDDFAEAHPDLMARSLPLRFYSGARLMSEEARSGWVEPDLRAMPWP